MSHSKYRVPIRILGSQYKIQDFVCADNPRASVVVVGSVVDIVGRGSVCLSMMDLCGRFVTNGVLSKSPKFFQLINLCFGKTHILAILGIAERA